MTLLYNTAAIEASELKKFLKDLKVGEKNWEKENELFLINSMIEHIGSTDSEFRDTLIYGTFCKLTRDKQLNHQLLIDMLDLCLSDTMLFKGIGEIETDTVFTRSFTTLLITLILYRDNEEGFLSSNTVLEIKDKLIAYINLEHDLRGFVAGKGWAHSIAHVADAFDELVKNENITSDLYLEILNPLWDKVFVSDAFYIHDEDERILVPILEMLNRGLEAEAIEDLVQNIHPKLEKQKSQIDEENYWILYANCKKFLKSFYLQIDNRTSLTSLKPIIKKTILSM
ncbi:DUF2785 domain-containing protein [Planococcus sp. S3-L1]|uniref:DUF2785 domain-containing protein n=1 Tax=Planococcus sp. S3-L1 TaxID=3046200 RepID=UPI0024BB6A10|nr:DUF2785 domain-containing protein [Planococcus sp. S3-L1]MDJ0333360.1 DUF2785 domain-containing protein [Planococcus sp. S3-L1]